MPREIVLLLTTQLVLSVVCGTFRFLAFLFFWSKSQTKGNTTLLSNPIKRFSRLIWFLHFYMDVNGLLLHFVGHILFDDPTRMNHSDTHARHSTGTETGTSQCLQHSSAHLLVLNFSSSIKMLQPGSAYREPEVHSGAKAWTP